MAAASSNSAEFGVLQQPTTVCLKMIFSDLRGRAVQATFPLSMLVRDVKRSIMTSYWPEEYGPAEKVEKIRIFHQGREFVDNKSLSGNAVFVDSSFATAVHVMMVQKSKSGPEPTSSAPAKSNRMCCVC